MRRGTCRNFAKRRLPRRSLETIVTLAFGRLGYLDGGPYGKRLLHRSAPSGGARHPLECYVIARSVEGLRRGTYHYSVRKNALVQIGRVPTDQQVSRFGLGQDWLREAGAIFLLTAVFARSQWKYRNSRAYRVLLLDIGHACQNVLLLGTALGLGTFCTAAIDDEAIDRYLGLDGISEGVLYLAAVGVKAPRRARARSGSTVPG
jgi:SagB-type dehydrogenase family enzyme